MTVPKLILASRSAARISMLQNAGYDFDIEAADIDEASIRIENRTQTPDQVALILAQKKAQTISKAQPGAYVIGSDQICAQDSRIFSKAETIEDAFEKLKALQGQPHQLHSAVSLYKDQKEIWNYCDTVTLTMKPMTDDQIQSYIDKAGDTVTSCAGAYAIEDIGIRLFEDIDGHYFSILGMPLLPLINALDHQGFSS